jgi:hypothetical protein
LLWFNWPKTLKISLASLYCLIMLTQLDLNLASMQKYQPISYLVQGSISQNLLGSKYTYSFCKQHHFIIVEAHFWQWWNGISYKKSRENIFWVNLMWSTSGPRNQFTRVVIFLGFAPDGGLKVVPPRRAIFTFLFRQNQLSVGYFF